MAVDAAGAGVGELVIWCRGKEASFPFKREDTPTDCTIIGIVDSEMHVSRQWSVLGALYAVLDVQLQVPVKLHDKVPSTKQQSTGFRNDSRQSLRQRRRHPKNHRYENARVMLCEQITPEGDPAGTPFWRWIQLMPVWATRS